MDYTDKDFITTRAKLFRAIWRTSVSKMVEVYQLHPQDFREFLAEHDIPIPGTTYYYHRDNKLPYKHLIPKLSGDPNEVVILRPHEDILSGRQWDREDRYLHSERYKRKCERIRKARYDVHAADRLISAASDVDLNEKLSEFYINTVEQIESDIESQISKTPFKIRNHEYVFDIGLAKQDNGEYRLALLRPQIRHTNNVHYSTYRRLLYHDSVILLYFIKFYDRIDFITNLLISCLYYDDKVRFIEIYLLLIKWSWRYPFNGKEWWKCIGEAVSNASDYFNIDGLQYEFYSRSLSYDITTPAKELIETIEYLLYDIGFVNT